jgi:hypothetical protein
MVMMIMVVVVVVVVVVIMVVVVVMMMMMMMMMVTLTVMMEMHVWIQEVGSVAYLFMACCPTFLLRVPSLNTSIRSFTLAHSTTRRFSTKKPCVLLSRTWIKGSTASELAPRQVKSSRGIKKEMSTPHQKSI